MLGRSLLVLRLYPEAHVWLERLRNSLTEPMWLVVFGRDGVYGRARLRFVSTIEWTVLLGCTNLVREPPF